MVNVRPLSQAAFLALAVAGCSADSDLKPMSKGGAGKPGGDVEVFDLTRPAEDASKLTIGDMYMSQMKVKGVNVGSLYVTTSGQADNVEIAACYDAAIVAADGTQTQHMGCDPTRKETVTRLVFAPFPNAKITVKARACVLPERAATPGVLCGPWKELTWNQSPNSPGPMADLLSRRERYRAEIAEFGQTLKATLAEFEKESAACVDRKQAGDHVAKVKNIVANFMQLGDLLISKAMEPGNMNSQGTTTPPSETREQPIPAVNVQGALDTASLQAHQIDTSANPELAPALEQVTLAPQLSANGHMNLEGGSPVGAMQILGNAVVELATATTQADANKKCYAQQNAEGKLKAASARIAELRAKLAEVENQIKAGGGAP